MAPEDGPHEGRHGPPDRKGSGRDSRRGRGLLLFLVRRAAQAGQRTLASELGDVPTYSGGGFRGEGGGEAGPAAVSLGL